MRTLMRSLSLVLAGLVLVPAVHAASASVSFPDSKNYRDAGDNERDTKRVLLALDKLFQKLATRLPADETLKIEVLDVDLAGRTREFSARRNDVRIIKGTTDWPAITLNYELQKNGATLASGKETIADMNFQQGRFPDSGTDVLYYEKPMIERWFQERLVEKKPARL